MEAGIIRKGSPQGTLQALATASLLQAAEPEQTSLVCTSASHRNALPTDLWLGRLFQRKAWAKGWKKPPWWEPSTQHWDLMVGQPGSHGHHCLPHAGTGLNRAVTATVHGHTNVPCHEHPATAKVIRADLERDHGGGRERRCTDRCAKENRGSCG